MRKLRPYRLRRRDGLGLRPRHGPLGFLEVAGWLAHDLVWVDGWFTSSLHGPVDVAYLTEKGWTEISALRFSHSRLDLLEIPGAAGQILIFPVHGLEDDPAFFQSLAIRIDGDWFRWSGQRMPIRPDLVARLPEKLSTLSADLESSFCDFLRQASATVTQEEDSIFRRHEVVLCRLFSNMRKPDSRGLEPVESREELPIGGEDEAVRCQETLAEPTEPQTVGEGPPEIETPDLAPGLGALSGQVSVGLGGAGQGAALSSIRAPEEEGVGASPPSVREPLSSFYGAPDQPLGICIDDCLPAGNGLTVVHGWVFDLEEKAQRLEWVSPGTEAQQILPGAFRYRRAAVEEMYQPRFGLAALGHHAFIALLQEAVPETEGAFFRLSRRDGADITVAMPMPLRDPFLALDRLWELGLKHLRHRELLETILAPGSMALEARCREQARVSVDTTIGAPVDAPDLSVVVPVERNMALIEHQLAAVAGESFLRRTEWILALDEDELTLEAERRLHHLVELYRVPLRLVVTRRVVSRANAFRLAAEQARGRRLVSLGPEVIPANRGWLDKLDRAHGRNSSAGVSGPKLLFHDWTIQHAGSGFVRAPELAGDWMVEPFFLGLHRSYPEANIARRVPTLHEACWIIDRKLFDSLGGLGGGYFGGEMESVDLCLRCLQAGHENWYLPAVEMFRLPGVGSTRQSARSDGGTRELDHEARAQLDRWQLTRRWGDSIEELMSLLATPPSPAAAVIARSG